MEKFPFVHKHYLYSDGKLTGNCCVCAKINPEEECFVCEECNFFFCKKCAKRTEEEYMRKLHARHLLKPTQRYTWRCDICRECVYSSGISMCCLECDFDVCYKCFWGIYPFTNF